MKLTAAQKIEYREYKFICRDENGFSTDDAESTYYFVPVFPGSNTYWMSVSICMLGDTFSKKYGRYQAMFNMYHEGERVLVSNWFVFNILEQCSTKQV